LKSLARIAGGLHLVNVLTGGFAIGVVSAALVVPGNALATAQNIQTHELRNGGRKRGPAESIRTPAPLAPQQLQALAYLPIDSQTISYNVSAVFFGFYAITIGYLVFKSGFLPATDARARPALVSNLA
jgi:hypothetical protein